MTSSLAGRRIVVTRPRAQATRLASLIAERGACPLLFPLLEIAPDENQAPLLAAIARLDDYSLAIFISPNAVDFSLPKILALRPWPDALPAAAIGPSTVERLHAHGLRRTLLPVGRFDSEALLDLPELQPERVGGRRIVLWRGNGGRELLAATLRARGAEVDAVACYRRSAPADAAAWHELQAGGTIDAWTISSSEGLRNLYDSLDEAQRERLRSTPVFVPHARIAEVAQQLGLREVVLGAAADSGIVAALDAYDWSAR
ncbi:MAG: uroporphyrinogen-III synthase [Candidatus Accumulibacter sp.]|mgnify:CR=1 FL=1|uniref:uroporphyrinogen-III synthase n=2 Tax=Accumulibacter sp. TaxID=2053492 RepID=UPI00287A1170|nr:uroporphyrinogen-III synthase [Accumulibacter sp.]MDS4015712.1 uroporphyrinogen-III synthase [Accumulibacter sp.]